VCGGDACPASDCEAGDHVTVPGDPSSWTLDGSGWVPHCDALARCSCLCTLAQQCINMATHLQRCGTTTC